MYSLFEGTGLLEYHISPAATTTSIPKSSPIGDPCRASQSFYMLDVVYNYTRVADGTRRTFASHWLTVFLKRKVSFPESVLHTRAIAIQLSAACSHCS